MRKLLALSLVCSSLCQGNIAEIYRRETAESAAPISPTENKDSSPLQDLREAIEAPELHPLLFEAHSPSLRLKDEEPKTAPMEGPAIQEEPQKLSKAERRRLRRERRKAEREAQQEEIFPSGMTNESPN